ncbi:GFA family protein [Emcibacter nanhaiensis]|uniref:CENP-V/GFA domain-containing protein n=1 Tax=Emcibacter nanhaiensis TaxID=1505037 RepID=A0A501PM71_9PROT|nr:hypothetical protein [Emcibacter nanhaiensis]TPD61599.1 hypothetical protein FIV46_05155 [Emcibacter nanhaiensis]
MTSYAHHGRCHCGNIDYDFVTSKPVTEFAVRQCGCTYCTKQRARYVADPSGELRITYADEDQVGRYRFGQKTADFIFCARCGVAPFVLCETEGQFFGIINTNSLDEADRVPAPEAPHDFDDEDSGDRLARRRKNWIGRVIINSAT